MRLLPSLLPLATMASAQLLIEGSSFGQQEKISQSGYNVPNWRMTGEGQVPELLNDRIILTPGHTGNIRGALWAETRVPEPHWIAQAEFKVSGPEKGSGNLQFWYVGEGQWAIGSSSIYTVGKFDGLAIVVDPNGPKGGAIRGFLNDGSIDFKTYHSVDSLAFGRCEYAYRNLGRPSKLKIKQNDHGLEVSIDDRLCLSTDKIRLPKEYYFGITAASAETPDSFEVNKFLLFTDPDSPVQQQFQQQQPFASQPNTQQNAPASQYTSSQSQFEDLHNRLQALSHTVENLVAEIGRLGEAAKGRHSEVIRNVQYGDKLGALEQKLNSIENSVRGFDSRFSYLQASLKDTHSNLVESLPKHMTDVISTNAPRMGLLIFVFIIVQIILVGVYQVYKRRSKQGPKKYL